MDGDDAPESDGRPQPNSANKTAVHEPFRLFDLPRELRDNIYDHALVDEAAFKIKAKHDNDAEDQDGGPPPNPSPEAALDETPEALSEHMSGLLASVKHRASTSVLLSNKAIKREYEERAKHAMTLVLRDNETYSFQLVTVPDQVKEVLWAEVHLILFCHYCPAHDHNNEMHCQAANEVMQHRIWVEHLLTQLPKLRTLRLHAYLCYDRYKSDCKETLPCERLVKQKVQVLCTLPNVVQLTLNKYDFHANPKLDGPKVVMLEWPVGKATNNEDEVEGEKNDSDTTTPAKKLDVPEVLEDDESMDESEDDAEPMDVIEAADPVDVIAEIEPMDQSEDSGSF